MWRRIFVGALITGTIAGLTVTLAQGARLFSLIEYGEFLEAGGGPAAAAPPYGVVTLGASLPRLVDTVSFNILTGVAFALILNAAIVLRGAPSGVRRGVLWGVFGFCVFALAPASGPPPEPPGIDLGNLAGRQLWWVLAVCGAALGLGLVVFARRFGLKIIGVSITLLPHAFGPPPALGGHGAGVAVAFARDFAVTSLLTTAFFWIVLGALAGYLQNRYDAQGVGR
ncbi:CbtA family protein [Varunaivibrio sulfuroxidans]|uniref:Cobalt transporter subunit CbtA n=1 Tax=Varunaivibrio sulfuroxidans TaxID=1773489 RepID=A0A4R3J6X9_9PROT|nr:CbtA family protein [Varunaivibrio sulfuroxidans]TCS61659.1 cobalt transporter subunit CbtA [Varunaivibrio sulfuroxidans]WES29470.1 CbtA family protein [Varunaivibrio sulfuroxidans]